MDIICALGAIKRFRREGGGAVDAVREVFAYNVAYFLIVLLMLAGIMVPYFLLPLVAAWLRDDRD